MFPGRLLKGHLGDTAHDAGGIHSRSRYSLSCGCEALVRSLWWCVGFLSPLSESSRSHRRTVMINWRRNSQRRFVFFFSSSCMLVVGLQRWNIFVIDSSCDGTKHTFAEMCVQVQLYTRRSTGAFQKRPSSVKLRQLSTVANRLLLSNSTLH